MIIDYEEDIFTDDDWEDSYFVESIAKKYPGWHLVKLIGFNEKSFEEVSEWLIDNIKGSYNKEGWRSECSYSIGVVFKSPKDAMLFKLRWV